MAAAISWLSPLNGHRLSGFTSLYFPSRPCIQSGNRASEYFSSLLQSSNGKGTSFLLPLSSYSKEKGKNNKFLPKRNASITAQAQLEEEEGRRNTGQGRGRDTDDKSFYVGNLPYSVDSTELLKLFKDAGNVTKVEVIYNKDTGRSRGFAFVTMATREEVSEAVDRFNGYEYRGRTLRVSSGPQPVKNNFTSRVGFRNVRSGGGGFDSANQIETGRSRGFAFVTMSSSEEVEATISSLDGADMDGRPLRVRIE
ncbi:hypothetical protein SUGI_0619480 [Cryptomeria japonica]|uniref:30 kDa ribonucleoprotein, chloroplastic n=1 Tax=Cryptomeria japonica TaxID=3369 RepID=UPI002414B836|nr:30 kDa ribonucleoprotein, chloroplastic [Cryptomeria japonica]GLJ30997.1 hypothetical protein SUGI_0619480 [Cryptomeria japonica]